MSLQGGGTLKRKFSSPHAATFFGYKTVKYTFIWVSSPLMCLGRLVHRVQKDFNLS